MSGYKWSEQEIQDLIDNFYNRPDGQSIRDFSLNYSIKTKRGLEGVRIKLQSLLGGQVPPSRHVKWNEPPFVSGDVLVMGDLHIPFHDADFINRCLALSKRWGIRKCIIGGDALDARSFSHWPDDFSSELRKIVSQEFERTLTELAEKMPSKYGNMLKETLTDAEHPIDIGEEFADARAVLKQIGVAFDEVLYIMGNHEAWVVQQMKKTIPAKDLGALLVGENPKWTVSPYYWCVLESGKVKYQVEHPKISGKGGSKKLAAKFTSNIIMLHNHQLSMQSDPSGNFLAIETGACCDVSRIQHANQRHDAADQHITGAVIVRNGKPWLLNKFTDWDLLLKSGKIGSG